MMSKIARNLYLIKEDIKKSCQIYKRDPQTVNLIAVSKTMEKESILEAISAGCQVFGENYINEVKEKWPAIKAKNPAVKLHFIGHLQSNKVKDAIDLCDVVQTLDSEKLALTFKKELAKRDKVDLAFFIQVNIGDEAQKGGVALADLDDFIAFSRDECGLNVMGLMCIPPNNECASPYFALLRKKAQEHNLAHLSMGMSADFEDAIALGATYVRLGTAVFGKRK